MPPEMRVASAIALVPEPASTPDDRRNRHHVSAYAKAFVRSRFGSEFLPHGAPWSGKNGDVRRDLSGISGDRRYSPAPKDRWGYVDGCR
jgi:hypothetical protein